MSYTTLISTIELAPHLADPEWAVVDCRNWLDDPERGRRDYLQAHIPGAVYAHLDTDLAGPVVPGQTGRHPLPEVETFARTLSNWGIGPGVQVVAYDDRGGAFAARLWWMLRWLGHAAVAVLDGGWPHWQAEGRPVHGGTETRRPRTFTPYPRPGLLATTSEVETIHNHPAFRLLDSRTAERYRGENEPFYPVAGHIPGAVCAPYPDNLGPDGLFRPAAELRARFQALLGNVPPDHAIFYCGSGVTAAHNLLALVHTGLGDARLYVGSWSEWIANPNHPIEKG
jgi:thiosulfate/3-mercaptopyruvate sulfurtransferase